jgi:hypothetical protein
MMTFEALVENADYVGFALLSLIFIIPRARFVRVFVALFAAVQLTRELDGFPDRTTIIWMSVLLGLAVLAMLFDFLFSRRVKMTPEERTMATTLLRGVGRANARHFIDQGVWLNGKAGDVLLREGEPVRQLYFLSQGEGRVLLEGQHVGYCRGGDLIADLPLFSREAASATVILDGPARFWCAPGDRVRSYLDVHGGIVRAIERNVAGGKPPPVEEPAVHDPMAVPAAA